MLELGEGCIQLFLIKVGFGAFGCHLIRVFRGGCEQDDRRPACNEPDVVSNDPRTAGIAHPGKARAAEVGMTVKDQEFRHPDTAAYLQSLVDEEVAKHSPIVR